MPDGHADAFAFPAVPNRRAAHTGVAEDARKEPEPAIALEVSGIIGTLLAAGSGPKKTMDELRRDALARAAEWARARGWDGPGSAGSQPQ